MNLDWQRIEAELNERGVAETGPLLTAEQCDELVCAYDDEARYRSRVVMARHSFGKGEYKYYGDPLPATVAELRQTLYPHLVPVANRWSEALGLPEHYPETLGELRDLCRAAGQTRPTPLILRYGAGDYNRLHQDLYGRVHFPLQVTILLSRPGVDFGGGELVLTEQRPRQQSRATVVSLDRGSGVVFAVNQRPVASRRGFARATMRHGVSEIRHGRRHALGVIFHDAA